MGGNEYKLIYSENISGKSKEQQVALFASEEEEKEIGVGEQGEVEVLDWFI